MKKNKDILKHCPYFYKIINFDFFEDDHISIKLLKIYKDYIFMGDKLNKEELKLINRLDYVLNKYIEDYYFRKEMRVKLLNIKVAAGEDILKSIVLGIINAFEYYENEYTRNFYFARWI